ncbi:hypothetical protein ElyMa_002243700 [Elysia marginata]|uniref:Uncharacterized protein n=1 Tax=Elysia marginata TaxID=1093978 RepID=A0AAV4FW89_9GAST|nr:hypothetical protein ElyMa_002243700 [Elysia marginata]
MAESTDPEMLMDWTDGRVKEIMERGLQPLRVDITEIKVTMNQVLEKLEFLCKDMNGRPNNLGISRENLPEYRDLQQEDKTRSIKETEGTGSSHGMTRENAEVKVVAGSRKDQDREAELDLRSEMSWFKNQVKFLHDDLLEQKERQEEILTKVLAHCAFTEGVIRGASKSPHEVKDGDLKSKIEDKVCEKAPGTDDPAIQQATATNEELFDRTVAKLSALTIGQSQRIIDKIRNPSYEDRPVFHFYLPDFKDSIGSGKTAYSLPWALDFANTFLVVRGVARFMDGNSRLYVGLERTMDALELGLGPEKPSEVSITARIKAMRLPNMPEVILGRQKLCLGESPQTGGKRLVWFEKAAASQQLVTAGYDSFKNNSLLIEFEITAAKEERNVFSMLSLGNYLLGINEKERRKPTPE